MIYRSILQCFADGFQWILLFYFQLFYYSKRRGVYVCVFFSFFISYLVIVCELLLFAIRSSVLEKIVTFFMNSDASFLMGYLRFISWIVIIIVCVCVFVYVYILYNMEHSVTLAGCSPMYFGFFLFRLARLILHYITSPK